MEASYSEQMKEEFRSTKAGILEDMREARLEKMRKKKAVGKGGRSWRSSKLKMEIVENTAANLQRLNKDLGFAFLSKTAGFDIIQHLVPYSSGSNYGSALYVGFLNTILI